MKGPKYQCRPTHTYRHRLISLLPTTRRSRSPVPLPRAATHLFPRASPCRGRCSWRLPSISCRTTPPHLATRAAAASPRRGCVAVASPLPLQLAAYAASASRRRPHARGGYFREGLHAQDRSWAKLRFLGSHGGVESQRARFPGEVERELRP
jgi:hypothetical protein